MKHALLLCTYNVDVRNDMYQDIIRWWMRNSSFDIFIVDSSDNLFDNDIESACRIHHFNQVDYTDCVGCSTTFELLSIEQALGVFGKEWTTNYDYIIKLTCKYMLPSLEKIMNGIKDTKNDMFVQSRCCKSHTNTEIFVIRSTKLQTVLDDICSVTPHCNLEKRLQTKLKNYVFKRLVKIPNTSIYKRGAGDMLKWL